MTPLRWTDEPIAGRAQDSFDRSRHARKIAELIDRTHDWDASVVFGLTGPWGSGKSSLIRMISESLEELPNKWHVAHFTPWAANDTAGVISDFYSCLSQALPKKASSKIRPALITLAKLSAPAAAATPLFGASLAEGAKMAEKKLGEQKPWRKAFDEAVDALKKAQTPVLVVADDIDRLQPDELMAVLKVVRLLGRFPGVQYLMAYDERTVFRTLETSGIAGEQGGSAERFMEKIVQYPLAVPPLLEYQLMERLNEGIDSALAQANRPVVELRRLGQNVELFRRRLATPRAIDRFVAQLRFQLPMLPMNEINDSDVILLTLLRVAYPSIYHQLPGWRSVLLTGRSSEFDFTSRNLERKIADWSALLDDVPPHSRGDAEALLVALFPKLSRDAHQYSSGEDQRRISDEKYFDRYFSMGVPKNDIADSEVSRILAVTMSGDVAELESVLTRNESQADLFITKARGDRSITDAPSDLRLVVAKLLSSCLHLLPEQNGNVFGGLRQRVAYWVADILVGAAFDSSVPASQILDVLHASEVDDRLDIWSKFSRDSKLSLPKPKALWVTEVRDGICESAVEAFLRNLKMRDGAPIGQPALFYVNLAINSGGAAKLRDEIRKLTDSAEVTVEDVAARFVSVAFHLGGENLSGHLEDIVQDWWNEVGPREASDLYVQPAIDNIDKYDLAWANRRKYAAGRVKRPPSLN